MTKYWPHFDRHGDNVYRIPARGHVTSRGYWHSGLARTCHKCHPPEAITFKHGSQFWSPSEWIYIRRWLLANDIPAPSQALEVYYDGASLVASYPNRPRVIRPVIVPLPSWLMPRQIR